MKNLKKIVLILGVLFMFSTIVNAQAFQKGTINIDLGVGLGIYGTSQTRTYERSATIDPVLVNTGLISANALNESSVKDTSDGAASTVIPISFEYGISNKIGVGVDFTYNNYFINDSDKVNLANVRACDFGPKFNYHPLNSDFYDLSLGLGLGFTTIGWNVSSTNNSESYKGSGFYLNLDIKNKFWFSEHIGAYLNLGYKGNFYSAIDRDTSVEVADLESNSWISNVSIKDEFTFTMHGANIGVGLAVKF
jgi:hypothetical protein